MLRKRIIFTLIYNQGGFMQSRNFRLQRVGNVNWLERNYKFRQISFSLDELIILNASRGNKEMASFAAVVSELAENVYIPVAAGGGIRCMEDAEILFTNGADKIVLNTLLYENPELVKEIVKRYGSQSVVASVDYKKTNHGIEVFIRDGQWKVPSSLEEYIHYLCLLDIGEIYLNSMDQDGTGFGYDLTTINNITSHIQVPLIIAGGAGNEKHLLEGLKVEGVNAVATANLFNFMGNGLPNARKRLIEYGENLAKWEKV